MKYIHACSILILTLVLASPAYAACTLPNGNAGDQMYNQTESKMQYCNGTDWIDMSGGDPGLSEPGDEMGDHTATQTLDMNNHKIIDMGTPTNATDLATKAYVDSRTGANESDPKVGAVTNNAWCQAGASTIECTSTSVGTAANILVAVDVKHEGSWGGAGTSNAWTKRDLTKIFYNNISGASLSNSQIALPAGTYYIDAVMPFHLADFMSSRLVKVSDGSLLLSGTSAYGESDYNNANVQSYSQIKGMITLTSSDSIRLEYYKTSSATFGYELGHRGGHSLAYLGHSQPEIYAQITVIKAASDNSCTQDGVRVANGASATFYTAPFSSNCAPIGQTRTCTSGTLSGSNPYANCTTCTTGTLTEIASSNYDFSGGFLVQDGYIFGIDDGSNKLYALTFDGTNFTQVAEITLLGNNFAYGSIAKIGSNIIVAGESATMWGYTFNGTAFTYKASQGLVDIPGYIAADESYIYVPTLGDNESTRAYTFNGTSFALAGNVTDSNDNVGIYAPLGTNLMFRARNGAGLTAMNFNGSSFSSLHTYDSSHNAYNIGGYDTGGGNYHIFLADYNGGLDALTYNTTSGFVLRDNKGSNGTYTFVKAYNNFVYVIGGAGLEVYSFNGTTMTLAGSKTSSSQDGYAHNDSNYLYYADGAGGKLYAFMGVPCP